MTFAGKPGSFIEATKKEIKTLISSTTDSKKRRSLKLLLFFKYLETITWFVYLFIFLFIAMMVLVQ